MRNDNYSRKDKFRSKKQAPANYFNGLKKKINQNYGNKVDILIPNIDIKGTGMNTTSLVNYAERKVNQSAKQYAAVWIVFDKDDYSDEQFDETIRLCKANKYHATWSNPNFEIWLLAHFKQISKYMSKDDVLRELNKEFQKNGLGNYLKNDESIFEKITKNNSLNIAVANCTYMEEIERDKQASQRNPMTKVYKLIDELKEYLK